MANGRRPDRRFRRGTGVLAALTVLVGIWPPDGCHAAPRVAVSLKPLHSLVSGVMEGVAEPDLLLRGAGSPHTYSLKPSEARMLAGADLVFWVGPSLESFLGKPLAALGSRARVVEVLGVPGVAALPAREGGAWEEDAAHGGGAHDTSEGSALKAGARAPSLDGHLWLDPANARAIVRAVADTLGRADPANRERYAANAGRLAARIDGFDARLAETLAPVRGVPYIVFHDAYQYFERRYGLRSVGSIAVSPERSPGARRVRDIREKILRHGARCVFGEPQFPPALLATLTEGTGARTGTLDPLGTNLPPGPDAWFGLMRALGAAVADCLR